MPPISVFDFRHRPEGLEFLACYDCNHGSREDDRTLAFMSRIFPDPSDHALEAERDKIFSELYNNNPSLFYELTPSDRQRQEYLRRQHLFPEGVGGPLNANGPLLNAAMHRIGVRFGLALHYYTTNRIVPITGAIYVRWYTNYDLVTGDYPKEQLMKLVGDAQTLRQGKFGVEGQFQFSSAMLPDGTVSVHLATFRLSMAVVAFVTEDATRFSDAPEGQLYTPGCLKTDHR
jgi:hypothetical protein